MKRIYIAGASAELDRCERFRDAVIALGFEVTYDWMTARRVAGKGDAELSPQDRENIAELCMLGVDKCDAFVLLIPLPPSETVGAWVEYGMAYGLIGSDGVTCVIVGTHPTIFTEAADHVATDADALDYLRGMLAGGQP